MQTRLKLRHDWGQQLRALLPAVRATRVAGLALFTLGLLWAGTVTLGAVAAALPLAADDPSLERRRRRWLATPHVVVATLWPPLLRARLAARAGQEVLLVFDPTPQNERAPVLSLGLVAHKRVRPLAWRGLPQQEAWPHRQIVYLEAMCGEVAAGLPASGTVTLLTDRGVTGPDLVHLCRRFGWHDLLRLSAAAAQGSTCRLADATECPVWDLVTGPGQRWAGALALCKQAGWLPGELTIHWRRGEDAPWLLVSDRPAGPARVRVREYRRRAQAEATDQDCTARGFDLERSKVTDLARFERLLLVVHLAVWWAEQLGLRAIRSGARHRFDRRDRRDLSVLRLGRRWLADRLDQGRLPPLPFRHYASTWIFTWLF